MNKRSFLKSLGAAIAAAAWPAPSFAEPETSVPLGDGKISFFGPVWFDYGNCVGISMQLPNGKRHACRTIVAKRQYTLRHELELKQHLLDWARAQYA